jgi:hypothetical protein
MSKRLSLILFLIPVLMAGLLLFLDQAATVSGSGLEGRAFSLPAAPLYQGGNETEPNDTLGTADYIEVNLTVAGRIPLTSTGDIDWYQLVLPAADVGRSFEASLEELVPLYEYKLKLDLYNAGGDLVDSQSLDTITSLSWASSVMTYYLRVEAVRFDINDPDIRDADYGLTVVRLAVAPTETPTATPIPWDSCEINDDINGTWSEDTPPGGPCQLSVGVSKTSQNFMPYTNQPKPNDDYFTFLAKAGHTYRITTDVYGGTDTKIWLYDPANAPIASDDDGGSGAGSRIEWDLGDGWYKILVSDRLSSTNPSTAQTYSILVEDVTAAAATPTFTPTPLSTAWDACEINDNISGDWPPGPCLLLMEIGKSSLNFVPYSGQSVPNNDYFKFQAKNGHTYRITTDVSGGADTQMWLYNPSNQDIAYDDDGGTGLGSEIEATLGDGFYKVLVRDRLGSTQPSASQTYSIIVEDVSGEVQPGPPSVPGTPDSFEPNYSFERASLIGLGRIYTNLNFVPSIGTDPDTDFYKLWVTSGKLYTCETSDLGTAANTNIIFCSGESWDYCFAGNDDVVPFDPEDPHRSRLTFFSSYTGYLYVMLGQVGAEQILPEEWKDLSYSLECRIDLPGTATPTPTSPYVAPAPQPTATPDLAAADTPPPPPTDTPRPQIIVRPMTSPTPPSAPPPATAAPSLYSIALTLYYDENENGQADPGEGISDVLVRAYDAISGALLSPNYTDETGSLRISVPADGPVRVSVPFFGFNQVVTTTEANIQIRIAPRP